MMSYGGGDERGPMFWPWFYCGPGVGHCNASMTLIFGGFGGPCDKWWRDRLLYETIFKRLLDIIRSKGKTRCQCTRSWRVPSKEFIVPEQDIAFSSKENAIFGNWKIRHTFPVLDFLRLFKPFLDKIPWIIYTHDNYLVWKVCHNVRYFDLIQAFLKST